MNPQPTNTQPTTPAPLSSIAVTPTPLIALQTVSSQGGLSDVQRQPLTTTADQVTEALRGAS